MQGPVVIKIGGAVLQHLEAFWPQVKALRVRAPVVLVHGGGHQATALATALGHQVRFIHGRRVTTERDLQIVEWTLRGGVNLDLVGQARAHGLAAVGLSGADGDLLSVERRTPWVIDGEEVDFGWVGEVTAVNAGLLALLSAHGFIPVVAPIGLDTRGQRYNVNADTVACELAVALQATGLLFVTAAGAVRREKDDPASRIPVLHAGLHSAPWIAGGMRVKVMTATQALVRGVREVFITGPDDLVARSRATQVVAPETPQL